MILSQQKLNRLMLKERRFDCSDLKRSSKRSKKRFKSIIQTDNSRLKNGKAILEK